jgi:ABC-2 type transport system permease protein
MRWNQEAATVTRHDPGAPRAALANPVGDLAVAPIVAPAAAYPPRLPRLTPLAALVDFCKKTLTIAEWEVRKLRHDPTDIITRTVQPVLWLLIFGEVFTRVRAFPTGHLSYLDFMAPGILAQSVLFISIFYGIAVIWERDLGVIHKFLASPTPRAALVLGKALSAGARALPQAAIIYVLALLLGVHMNWNPLALLGVVLVVMLGAALFSTFSVLIACVLKSRERVMGIGQVLTMPLFFASNAIYPVTSMPPWLRVIARANPLSYEVDALRAMMLAGESSAMGLGTDFAVLLLVSVALIALGAWLYPNVIR